MRADKITGLIMALVILLGGGQAAARSLYWSDMSVKAELDADGRLHVMEQQTIVFTGAWNGGERRFNLRPGQKIRLNGIYRKGADGKWVQLTRGNLKLVDHWVWHRADTLRWRARLPSDPVFNRTPFIYVLDYTLSGILIPEGQGYRLNHDFCFPDRDGVIQRFFLDLSMDPAWQVQGGGERNLRLIKTGLAPGQSVIVSRLLLHPGGAPAAVGRKNQPPAPRAAAPKWSVPQWLRVVLLGLIWLLTLYHSFRFWRHEKGLNRFLPLVDPEEIDEEWLNNHVFSLAPEVVGATWDKSTDSSEVAAVLARMVQEGKMESRVEPWRLDVLGWFSLTLPGQYILSLKLLQDRSSLHGYERELVDGLFIDGDETDTKKVKKYYRQKRTTYNPVSSISDPLAVKVGRLTGGSGDDPTLTLLLIFLLGFASLLSLVLNYLMHETERPDTLIWGIGLGLTGLLALGAGLIYRDSAINVRFKAMLFQGLALLPALVFTVLVVVFFREPLSPLLMAGTTLLAILLVRVAFACGWTRDSARGVELRRLLASARVYLERELKREKPRIRDRWFPWLVAFGLGPQVDSWFHQYGTSATYGRTIGSGGMGTGGGYGFSGGGGQFGGGGVSGAWSAAASSMSATAASGGSSSGGGGGGSGGGGGGGF